MNNLLLTLNLVFKTSYNRELPDKFFEESIIKFAEYMNDATLISNLSFACSRVKNDPDGAIKYFCKICWSDIDLIRKAMSKMRS